MQFDKILKSATFYYLLFGIFSIIFLFKSYLSVDILGSDEVVYLNASNAIKIPFQDNYNGPIYAIWYYVITFFTQNFISTYYFNYFFLSVIPCFLLLVLLIKMGYNKAISLLITLLLLNSSFNLYLLPKISQLVVILIITALLFVKKAERIFNQFFIIGIFTLIIAYIRPEYYVAFGIAILLCYITFIIEYPKNSIFKKSDFYKLVILTSLAISFYLLLGGTPLSNRSFDAFVQHYIRNHCEQNGLIHPVSVHEEYKLFYEVYSKKPTSLLEAAFAEPTKFFWHVFTNLKNAVLKTVRIIYDIYLGGLFSLPAVLINISKVAILLFLLVIIDWRKSIQKLQFKTYLNVVFKTILLFFPILIGIVLVYPRDHYLVVLLAPIFVVISEIIAVIELRKFNKVDFNSRKNAVFQGFF